MKLIVEPKPYTQEIYIDTKLGRLDISQFLRIAIARDGRPEARLTADAGIDHATLYNLLNHKSKGIGLRAVMLLLYALGYDFVLKKRD